MKAQRKAQCDRYFRHIESITSAQGRYFPIGDEPGIVVASYQGVPEEACVTAFSFGLSAAARPEWINSRPELVISMDSHDDAWGLAMGEVIHNAWGKSLFSYGDIVDFGTAISDESAMSAFLVFACTILDVEDVRIDLGCWTVNISQLYPIYRQEIALIHSVGAERFFSDNAIDFFDPSRGPVLAL